jgi:hypothetical protein
VLQEQLVEELARIEWRLKRAVRAEGGAISKKTKANMQWSATDLNFAAAAAKARMKAGVPVIGIDPYDLPDADTLERNLRYEKTMWKRRQQVIEELGCMQAQHQSIGASTDATPRAVDDRHVHGESRTKAGAGKHAGMTLSLWNAPGADGSTQSTPNADDMAARAQEQPKA